MSVEVRPATTDDVAGVRRVAHAAWEAAYDDLLAAETREQCLSEWYSPVAVERAVTDTSVGYFVAVDDDVVGYASGSTAGTEGIGHLSSIYVHPDHWDNGVGSHLLDAVEQFLAAEGVREVRIRVLAENDLGIEFYRARGYEREETQTAELGGRSYREHVFRGRL
ncbi:GNAT family N-acetyltransferase [Halostella sp. PRR32]|uniref:GNAT family N-acetyltransferase n=1 Tax=Halostella sp. PRR32 TaxID=3098147 RepID=UPI002B1E8452|nr:GNAT family N-acetyltransferase [Halostella sp. PRR32]